MEFKVKQGVYIKSNNNSKQIIKRYTYCLIICIIMSIIAYLLFNQRPLAITLIKNTVIGLAFSSLFTIIMNILDKKNTASFAYNLDSNIQIALILSFMCLYEPIHILVGAIWISLIARILNKKIRISATIYGMLAIIIYNYFSGNLTDITFNINNIALNNLLNKDNLILNLIGIDHFSPILAIISFIYLFTRKSIKYSISFTFIVTYLSIMLIYSILSGLGMQFVLYHLINTPVLFLSTYIINDYSVSPACNECGIIYGIIIGVISSILYFILPPISLIIAFILGQLWISKILEKNSYKLKYNLKYYYLLIIVLIIISIISAIALSFIF